MRGQNAEDRRADQVQALTFLGLLADDVSLATMHYPVLRDVEERALSQLAEWIAPADASDRRASPIRRPNYLSDPAELLHRTALLASQGRPHDPSDMLESLLDPIRKVLAGTAEVADLEHVRKYAEVLSRVTLVLTEQLTTEKGSTEWTPTASSFSVAL